MKRLIFPVIFFLTLIFSIPASAVVMKWDIPLKDRLEIVKTADVKYFVNTKLSRVFQERNIVDLTCIGKDEKSNRVSGSFSVFRKESSESVFLLKDRFVSEFTIDSRGKMLVNKKFLMPNLRHVPGFPEKDLKIGDTWKFPVNLILRSFSVPLNLVLEAEYKLVGFSKINDRKMALINYSFVIDKDLTKRRFPSDFPLKIIGKNSGTIYWDTECNCLSEIKDKYRIVMIFRHGRRGFGSVEFQMNILSRARMYPAVSRKDKEKAKEELKKELPPDSNIEVVTDKRGLVLRLGEILFDFDSDRLKLKSKDILDKVAGIIKKKYPDREIIVEGHTDSTGRKQYNLQLSKKRAFSVADYLKNRKVQDKLSYRGFGPDKPIESNRTKSGRQKNRRVEIIIKLN